VLLRPGTLTRAQMEYAMGQDMLSNEEHAAHVLQRLEPENALKTTPESKQAPRDLQAQHAPRASGTLASHYAPNAPLRLMDAKALQTALNLLGEDAKNIAIYARSPIKIASSHVILRRMPDDALATAQQLFAVLREFDAKSARLIWVETVPAESAWDGVRDRLQRAAA
jgi:L-threonylcarbamoyladenylate synthase